ncbi:AAA family ATPase [Aliidiomarina halalkaliphila]|uniref:endopeptidase La n=1 Tax=Aliidiomarina halalkaliphila TaxID=2593535 RepID=A0A552X3X8_9GAMM|nr:AAA family ATPase [Aliidiomarina halalkaliphila]TRW49740.1 AAA family ATPase [Aliidiomarina halalkaliphila]
MNDKSMARNQATHLLLAPKQLKSDAVPWLQGMDATNEPDALVGQERALTAVARAQQQRSAYSHVYMSLPAGMIAHDIIQQLSERQQWSSQGMQDWVYLANPEDERAPLCVSLPAGAAEQALIDLWGYLNTPVNERKGSITELADKYNSAGYRHYLQLIADKAFEDIPGNELANIIVSHQEPRAWVYCDRVTATTLFGDIRVQNVEGQINTELHLIRSGALLEANGGTLLIQANELLIQPELWRQLKHVIRSGTYQWQQLPASPQGTLHYEPEPIPIDIKLILVGSRDLFAQLRELDAEFSNFFPYFAEFRSFYAVNQFGEAPYGRFLSYLQNTARCAPLTDCARLALLNFSAEMAEHQNELSLDAVALIQILEEANTLAREAGEPSINGTFIEQAIHDAEHRERLLAELNWQSILERQIIIDTEGEAIGQINGLTVVSMAGIEFGEPSRITATVHYGEGDIIDIERKAELSGAIHTKGIMILTAYLANLFARQEPMPLSATLVFEQSYHEVDGDSASLAELCCLMSALSETPIDQSIAVTGAIDQFGNVQAIGGINEKIHGYFEICKMRGLNTRHAVIVPKSNMINLHLRQEVIDAVAAGEFAVYAVNHATEAFELLMNTPCGEPLSDDKDTLFGRVHHRLQDALAHQHPARPSLLKRLFSRS